MIRRQSYRAIKPSGGPIPDDRRHNQDVAAIRPPPAPPPPVPVLDAITLLYSWRRARMNGDRANAAALLAELERLAERPKRRAGGEHDEQYG